MRAEHLDVCRRELLQGLADLLTAAGLDVDARERVESGLAAILDDLLVRLGGYSIERDRRAAIGASEFALLALWPVLLHRYGAALLDERSAMRWRAAVDARARAGDRPAA